MPSRRRSRRVPGGFTRLLSAKLPLAAGVVVAVLAAWLVLAVSIAGVARSGNPVLALRWAPRDAAANANQAVLAMAGNPSSEVIHVAEAAARGALKRDPTVVAAIRVFGAIADARNDELAGFALYRAAERLSRRDQATQLWLIQYHSRRGNGVAAVGHFDTALRTSNRNWGVLISFMATASADPRLVRPLAGLLDRRPPWRVTFLQELIARGSQLDHVVALSRGRLDPAVPDERAATQALIARLVASSRPDLAWDIYAGLPAQSRAGGADAIRDGGFEQAEGFAPFNWALVDEADLWARRDSRPDGRGGNSLSLSASNGRSGEVARQLVRLPPGSYLFSIEAGAVPADQTMRPQFTISCAGEGGAQLLAVRPAGSGQGAQRLAARFAVPPNCRWQSVAVRIGGGDTPPETLPWIDNLAIRRVTS